MRPVMTRICGYVKIGILQTATLESPFVEKCFVNFRFPYPIKYAFKYCQSPFCSIIKITNFRNKYHKRLTNALDVDKIIMN